MTKAAADRPADETKTTAELESHRNARIFQEDTPETAHRRVTGIYPMVIRAASLLAGIIIAACTVACTDKVHRSTIRAEHQRIQVGTKIQRRSLTEVFLSITLVNLGENELVVPYSYLPWNRDVMGLELFTADNPERELRQQEFIEDPLPGPPWRLEKGRHMRGEINLTERFPDLAQEIKKGAIVLIWNYEINTEDDQRVHRFQGREVIRNK